MANGDPTKSQVYRRRWFYDEALDDFRQNIEKMSIEEKEVVKTINGLIVQKNELNNFIPTNRVEELKIKDMQLVINAEIDKLKPHLQLVKDNLRNEAEHYNQFYFEHPFLIGPATLESLLNQRPTTYDYVRDGKVPFNNMFFEFLEPHKLRVPFNNIEKNLVGIALNKANNPLGNYHMKMYYSDGPKDIVFASFFLNLDDASRFQGTVAEEWWVGKEPKYQLNEDIYSFKVDINSNSFRYSSTIDLAKSRAELKLTNEEFFKRIIEANNRGDFEFSDRYMYQRQKSFSEVDDPEIFYQMANLSANIVNYINAHNVTIVQREREAEYRDRRPNGKSKKRIVKRPYSLIVLKDRIIMRSDKSEEKLEKCWELHERIFVRGHNRRYHINDNEQAPRMWIPPYIKGPENAPFAEQRYQVLYEKLGREIQMFRDLGLKHDSEMWMERNR